MSKRKNVDITIFFFLNKRINIGENNDWLTIDPSSPSLNCESSLPMSKGNNELNIFKPQLSEINLN